MNIIKVDAIDSTNSFLRDLNRKKKFDDIVCVVAESQRSGKGQMGTVWQSEPGKNLTCSVFMPIKGVGLQDQFYISMITSLAICDVLNALIIPKISIKWPNDILSDRMKVCGILIENIFKSDILQGAILGIGLNINQTKFDNLPQASSLKLVTGRSYDTNEILVVLIEKLKNRFENLNPSHFFSIKEEYLSFLFRKNKPSTFQDSCGNSFVGIIQGVSQEGKLKVLIEDEKVNDFDLKEIRLLY